MCTPTLAIGLSALGTYQNIQSAQAQADAASAKYNYDAQVAEQNARLANQQAESNAEAGAMKASQVLQRARQVKASQAAAYSANGVDISTGSPLDVLADTEAQGQLDKAETLYDAATNTWSLQSQAVNYQNQASASRAAAANAQEAGKMNKMGALLTGISSIAGQYSSFKNTGAIGSNSSSASTGTGYSTSTKYTDAFGVPVDNSGNYFISSQYNDYSFGKKNKKYF